MEESGRTENPLGMLNLAGHSERSRRASEEEKMLSSQTQMDGAETWRGGMTCPRSSIWFNPRPVTEWRADKSLNDSSPGIQSPDL